MRASKWDFAERATIGGFESAKRCSDISFVCKIGDDDRLRFEIGEVVEDAEADKIDVVV